MMDGYERAEMLLDLQKAGVRARGHPRLFAMTAGMMSLLGVEPSAIADALGFYSAVYAERAAEHGIGLLLHADFDAASEILATIDTRLHQEMEMERAAVRARKREEQQPLRERANAIRERARELSARANKLYAKARAIEEDLEQ